MKNASHLHHLWEELLEQEEEKSTKHLYDGPPMFTEQYLGSCVTQISSLECNNNKKAARKEVFLEHDMFYTHICVCVLYTYNVLYTHYVFYTHI